MNGLILMQLSCLCVLVCVDAIDNNERSKRSASGVPVAANDEAEDEDVFFTPNRLDEGFRKKQPEHIINKLASENQNPPVVNTQSSGESNNKDDGLLVRTNNGYVKGKAVYTNHIVPGQHKDNITESRQRINAWLGIPYAEKPIGDLRFRRPVPIRSWRGIYHATKLQNTCYQMPDMIFPGFWGTELWNPNTAVSEVNYFII